MFKKATKIIIFTVFSATNCYADSFNTIYKTASALSFGSVKNGSYLISTAKAKKKPNRTSRSISTPTVISKSISRTIVCPTGGTLTASGKAVIDTSLKTMAMNAALTLRSCNAVSGRGTSYLSASQSGSTINYSSTVPATKFTGTCQDGTAGTFSVYKLAVVGQYDQSSRVNNATISGSFSGTCGSNIKFSCNWPTPVSLSNKEMVMSYCTQSQQ